MELSAELGKLKQILEVNTVLDEQGLKDFIQVLMHVLETLHQCKLDPDAIASLKDLFNITANLTASLDWGALNSDTYQGSLQIDAKLAAVVMSRLVPADRTPAVGELREMLRILSKLYDTPDSAHRATPQGKRASARIMNITVADWHSHRADIPLRLAHIKAFVCAFRYDQAAKTTIQTILSASTLTEATTSMTVFLDANIQCDLVLRFLNEQVLKREANPQQDLADQHYVFALYAPILAFPDSLLRIYSIGSSSSDISAALYLLLTLVIGQSNQANINHQSWLLIRCLQTLFRASLPQNKFPRSLINLLTAGWQQEHSCCVPTPVDDSAWSELVASNRFFSTFDLGERCCQYYPSLRSTLSDNQLRRCVGSLAAVDELYRSALIFVLAGAAQVDNQLPHEGIYQHTPEDGVQRLAEELGFFPMG